MCKDAKVLIPCKELASQSFGRRLPAQQLCVLQLFIFDIGQPL